MKLTQKEQLIGLFKENGYRLSLGQIMKTNLAAEYRARISELRKAGYQITCLKGETPSQNVYELIEPAQFDESGQIYF